MARAIHAALEGSKNKMSAVSACLKSAQLRDLTCVTSQQSDVEPTLAKKRDKRVQLEIPQQQHLSLIRETSLQDPSFLPSLSGISIHQLFLAVYKLTAYLFWLLNCAEVAYFPSSPALSLLCFSTGFGSIPGGKPAETPEGFCFCSPRFVRVRQKTQSQGGRSL